MFSFFLPPFPLLHKCYQSLQQVTALIFMHINDCSSERSLGTTTQRQEPSVLSASCSALKKKKIPKHGFSALLLLSTVHGRWMAKAFFKSGALWEPAPALVFRSHRCPCPSAPDARRGSLRRPPKHGTKPSLGARVIRTAEQIIFFYYVFFLS